MSQMKAYVIGKLICGKVLNLSPCHMHLIQLGAFLHKQLTLYPYMGPTAW